MALKDILNAIGGGLSSAGRGIGKGFSIAGKTLADPFYESDEEMLARMLGEADFGPTASAGLAGGYSPNFKKKKNFWDVLGDIGETTGRVATQVGRQLPILGPYVQAGEYGILKGIGKEDSDWAKGNIFAEREQAYEELQKQRAFEEQERQQKTALFPLELEGKRTGIEADKATLSANELLLQKTQMEIKDKLDKRRALVLKYGSEDNAAVAALDAELLEDQKRMRYLDLQIESEIAQRKMYETRGNENQPLMTMQEFEQAAREYADKVSEFDSTPGAWQKAYEEYKRNNQWMLTAKSGSPTPPIINPNPLSMVGIGDGRGSLIKAPSAVGTSAQPPMGSMVSSVSSDLDKIDRFVADNGYDATLEHINNLLADKEITWDEYTQYLEHLKQVRKASISPLNAIDLNRFGQ